ncbi:hypothetical protein [Rhizobium sp. BK602]|uniref:hypothetical protein n=1 Tax=Rhizobium sp. BK602 TaxID=2586986 RepID=UPI0016206AB5|nr:hypothetical protein [Rhizobium sp. BK602]MBB3608671.1 hypothetical protein [Rhizobium sp. BK602]
MFSDLKIDDRDLVQLHRAIAKVPGEIKAKAMRRAMSRMSQMARTRIVDRNASHVKLPKQVVASLTTAAFNAGGSTSKVTVESGWMPLQRLGAVQTASGAYVNLRGSYRHAFIAAMKSGHVGVFRRVPGTRMSSNPYKEQIRELFGPNPAHAIGNHPDIYLDILAKLIEQSLLPRFAHELDFILSKLGR